MNDPSDENSSERTSSTASFPEALEVKIEIEEPKSSPVHTENTAVTRFKTCRWYEAQENSVPYCSNRDVLPFAGKNGFNPKAWCPDCTLYKVKRKVNKRSQEAWDDY